MSYYRRGNLSPLRMVLLALCALGVIFAVEASKSFQVDPLLSSKIAAAEKMAAAMTAIQEEKLKSGVAINRDTDPNQTGLIGEEFNDLTTSLGSLPGKRTTTNPNFAGLLVELLSQAKVKPGDSAAINASGSFPALNIAVLSAVHVLQLNPVIISSVGASTYGANIAGWTWLDMERVLREKGIFPYTSTAASLGGLVDNPGGLDGRGIPLGLEAVARSGIPYLDEKGHKTIKKDVDHRMELYSQALGGRRPAVFINVGGSLASLGEGPEVLSLSPGLSFLVPSSRSTHPGVLFRMNQMGVPVIHLLNVKKLARRYGLPVDPIPLPHIPSGGVLKPQKYSFPVVLGGIVLLTFLLAAPRSYRMNPPVLK